MLILILTVPAILAGCLVWYGFRRLAPFEMALSENIQN